MKILALDVATDTGYAVFDGKKLIDQGLISLNPNDDYKTRFKNFRLGVHQVLKTHKPKYVVLEGVYQGRNPKITAYLNNLRGIAIELVPKRSLFISVQVKAARAVIMKNGNASKSEVFEWATKKYKLKGFELSSHNDITDAILIGAWAHEELTSKL